MCYFHDLTKQFIRTVSTWTNLSFRCFVSDVDGHVIKGVWIICALKRRRNEKNKERKENKVRPI
ncbi:uncharacterized protein An18g05290 [Aspergillus niger]|uniref:Contig An18c0170, genomic contig n=2 Tax=Aspergillus niger TaxID=5061 RepID=A2RB31_ASPNC|nr:uncharacterized protein An18g05290 [Aspergillus niger]CAK97451.1 unnamed protein product [Aspergillus niger]